MAWQIEHDELVSRRERGPESVPEKLQAAKPVDRDNHRIPRVAHLHQPTDRGLKRQRSSVEPTWARRGRPTTRSTTLSASIADADWPDANRDAHVRSGMPRNGW